MSASAPAPNTEVIRHQRTFERIWAIRLRSPEIPDKSFYAACRQACDLMGIEFEYLWNLCQDVEKPDVTKDRQRELPLGRVA